MNNKSNILSVVSYDSIKQKLKLMGFKFSNTQFKTAKNKRIYNKINLRVYRRFIPTEKEKLSEDEQENIIKLLNDNSRYSSEIKNNIRYFQGTFFTKKQYKTTIFEKLTLNNQIMRYDD